MAESFKLSLQQSSDSLERFIANEFKTLTEDTLDNIEENEKKIAKWWNGQWHKKMSPSFQLIAEQLNLSVIDQTRNLKSITDAKVLAKDETNKELSKLEDQREYRTSTGASIVATLAGGFGRATSFSKALMRAWERESVSIGLNKKNSSGAASRISAEREKNENYLNIFCDPDDSNGKNKCNGSDPKFYNADVKPNEYIYNNLTIPIDSATDTEGKMLKTLEALHYNLIGSPSVNPINKASIESSVGQELFLDRRSYLARYAAVRSVPQIISGWRVPGSKMGQWLKELRKDAKVPEQEISDNPSYKEIMHALTVDRFSSGKYAIEMLTDRSATEMEKLVLNSLYLMHLRDYYELLERTALVLSVQLAIMTEQIPTPDSFSGAKLGN